jgi:2-aminobenzoate-CoA ligase
MSREESAAPAEIVVQRRIEWTDTDASGYYHNSVAFRLFESAETVLLERLGLLEEIYGRLPRVHLSADYKRLLAFSDVVDVRAAVIEVGRSSIAYAFSVERAGELCVTGKGVAVLVEAAGGAKTEWPERWRVLLLTAGPQVPQRLT